MTHELGLDLNTKNVTSGNNAVASRGVSEIDAAYAHALACGATARQAATGVGDDIKVASVANLIGNVIGLIQNPQFKI